MIDAGIHPGDILIADHAQNPIVVLGSSLHTHEYGWRRGSRKPPVCINIVFTPLKSLCGNGQQSWVSVKSLSQSAERGTEIPEQHGATHEQETKGCVILEMVGLTHLGL